MFAFFKGFVLLLTSLCVVSAISRQAAGDVGVLSDTVDERIDALNAAEGGDDKMTDQELDIIARHFTPEQIVKINRQLAHINEPKPAAMMRFAQTKGILSGLKKFGSGVAKGLGAATGANKPTQAFSGAHGSITVQDEACVMCQYLVEKVQAAVMEFSQSPAPPTFLETTETVTPAAAPAADEEPAATVFLEQWGTSVSGTNAGGIGGILGKTQNKDDRGSAIGFITSGRKRSVEFMGDMPADLRFSPLTNPAANAEQDRAKYKLMEMEVYSMVHQMCSTSMPLMYLTYCQALMRNFQRILQSLQYGDRTDQICLMVGQCLPDSYAAINPHALTRVQAPELKKRVEAAIAMTPSLACGEAKDRETCDNVGCSWEDPNCVTKK